MTTQSLATDNYIKINKLINSSRFNESFLLLNSKIKTFPALQKLIDPLRNLESTYRYMLDYLAGGNEDPTMKEMLFKISDNLHSANDSLLREARLVDSSDLYSSTRRMIRLKNLTFASLLENFKKSFEDDNKEESSPDKAYVSQIQAQALSDLFDYVWTSYNENPNEFEEISISLSDSSYPEYYKSLIISALILGNTAYFNPETVQILLDQYENSDSQEIRAKALTGILLSSLIFPKRIAENLNLKSRILLASGDEEFANLIKSGLLTIIRTYDTKRIDDKMRNEVIPGLMKMNPEFIDKFRNMASESENFLSDANPEWEDFLENSELGKKIQEINDMQLEGADVMVTAFSNLKNYPFFNTVSNWFLPFNPHLYLYSTLEACADGNEESLKNLSMVMCDSDIHSFMLSLSSMPGEKSSQLLRNMEVQMKEAKEAMEGAVPDSEEQVLKKKIKRTLQDLYRFFKFFRKNKDFSDPFALPFVSSNFKPLIEIFGIDLEAILAIAEFYLKNNYYQEAAGMFELADSLQNDDFSIWEKIGFSYERLGKYEEAVRWYKKAELLNSGNSWLDKKLAISLKNSGNKEEALKYYDKVLTDDPENYHLLMSVAQCLIDLGRYEEALRHLHHARYLKPEKISVVRAIAWCELLLKNYEKANNLYVEIRVNPQADKTDFLNAAHSYLAQGNMEDAIKNYRTFIDKTETGDIKELVIAFRDDSETMKKLGIPSSTMRLVIDKLRYDLLG